MKKLFLCVLGLLAMLSCRGPLKGKGPTVAENRTVSRCQKLILSMDADIEYHLSDSVGLTLYAPENFMEHIETESSNGRLMILSNRTLEGSSAIRVVLHSPSFESIEINGAGKIVTQGSLHSNAVALRINGSGSMSCSMFIETLKSTINGSGHLILSGKVKSHTIEINGSGGIMADSLQCEEASLSLRGSGDVNLNVSRKLTSEVIGSGNVRYAGQPQVKTKITGSGDVRKIEP